MCINLRHVKGNAKRGRNGICRASQCYFQLGDTLGEPFAICRNGSSGLMRTRNPYRPHVKTFNYDIATMRTHYDT